MTDESNTPIGEPEVPAPAAPEAPAAPPAPPAAPPAAPAAPPAPPAAPAASPFAGDKNKLVAAILAIVLGALGIHKFYLGYQKEGIIMIAVTVVGSLLLGLGAGLMGLVGLIEGIIYITKSDEDFYNTYVAGQKPWF